MDEILLSELIERTQEAIRPFEHSQSTLYQYQFGWAALSRFFIEQDQKLFSKQLADQFILETKRKLATGVIKKWRYKLFRRAALMLIACYEDGHFTWKYYKDDLSNSLRQSGYRLLLQGFLEWLKKDGKADRTVEIYEIVARQFLEYLEQKKVENISEVRLSDVGLFIPYISNQYQPASMRTVLSSLRSFLRYIESEHLSELSLSNAVPSSFGRKTEIIPTITAEEERKLLGSVDRSTLLGKRNNAILLLALRTGLRSTDIANLKLGDIHWKRNTIEIVQEKTDTPLVLPLLTDVGNAIADYILNGRPDSPLTYIFLRTQAPYRKLSGRAACYAISVKMMKDAGVRQGDHERKGLHCLRHSLAARLLAGETPLPVISSILGHRDKDSTKVYLSTDLVHLRACALNLNGIEITKEELQ